MKKSVFRPISNGKLFFIAAALTLTNSACTKSIPKDLEGNFTGTDGSSQLPSQVDSTISLAGDGLLSGTWISKGEIPKGQLSGKLGNFGNELILYAQAGSCTGQFRGDFVFENGELKGTLKNNPNCADRSYKFSLKKVH